MNVPWSTTYSNCCTLEAIAPSKHSIERNIISDNDCEGLEGRELGDLLYWVESISLE